MSDTRECPYCAEIIQATAKKCRYCGEWFNQPTRKKLGRGSSGARSVTKGLKEKSLHDSIIKSGGMLGIIVGLVVAWGASKLGVRGDAIFYIAFGSIVVTWFGLAIWYWIE